jgi:uncharacterized membrane protein
MVSSVTIRYYRFMPFSPLQLILFIFLLGFLLAVIQVGIFTVAFAKLGLSQGSAFLLLFSSLFGSAVNLPLFSIKAEKPDLSHVPQRFQALVNAAMQKFHGRTVIAVNAGGCLIPLTFSVYLIDHNPIAPIQIIIATAVVAGISYAASRPVPGLGIGMPIFVGPLAAALVALTMSKEYTAPLAYVCGTMGVLIGADLLRLGDIRRMGTPIASIGGAGTFDGIFITGIVAVLLA